MPRYLTQATLSPQAVSAMVGNPQDRAEAIRPLMEAAGGKLEQYYFDVTENTIYTISEGPDNESVAAVMSAAFAGGALLSYKVTAILTSEEMVNVFKRAGSLNYQPPSA